MKNFILLPLLAVGVLIAPPLSAHQSHNGWEYDIECCHNRDCAPVKSAKSLPGGRLELTVTLTHPSFDLPKTDPNYEKEKAAVTQDYTVIIDFNTFPKEKLKSSKDENIHLCLSVYGREPIVLCLYMPADV